jgi:hypothetical protein
MYILNQTLGNADCVLFQPDRDNYTEPFIEMKNMLDRMGYCCEAVKDQPIDSVAWVFFWNMDSVMPHNLLLRLKYALRTKRAGGSLRNILAEAKNTGGKVKTALFMYEPPLVSPRNWKLAEHDDFNIVFTWDPTLVDGDKYHQFYLPNPINIQSPTQVPFSERKLLVAITSNKHHRHPSSLSSFRHSTILYFSKYHPDDFDLYGFGWNPPFFRWLFMQLKGSKSFLGRISSYRGVVTSKSEVYSNYKFSICFENMKGQDGLVTEKIIDVIRGGSVPIYLGAPDISRYISPNAYIDMRNFNSYSDLYSFLSQMSESSYQKFIDAGIEMFNSGKMDKFLSPHFVTSIISRLELPVNPECINHNV